ncbi:hypothetical protein AN219_37985 [Streptomyces nanshensis]|nr:hypothetical protein AN219_37985 [Streptomyces nanshensis]
MHGPDFSADPQPTYRHLRTLGPIAPVEISPGVPGMITTTYRSALYLLRNTPDTFSKDPRHWRDLREGRLPADAAAVGMMKPRDNALWLDGKPHARLRRTITDSLRLVDTHDLAKITTRIADRLIDAFISRGQADLVAEFADPLPVQVVLEMFGAPPDLGQRIVGAVAQLFDGSGDPVQVDAELTRACLELTWLKRTYPARDFTTWLVQHEEALTDEEMKQQILLVMGAASSPATNLIANIARLMIDDDRFAGNVFDGSQSVDEALDHALATDPPVSNYSPLYARRIETYEGVTLHPGIPMLVSFAAANAELVAQDHGGNRSHLAFSTGVHGCPATNQAREICATAAERLLDRLPGLELACPTEQLTRRPGPFHSGWTSLPVTFPPGTPAAAAHPLGETAWTPTAPAAPTASMPPQPTSTPRMPTSAPPVRPRS